MASEDEQEPPKELQALPINVLRVGDLWLQTPYNTVEDLKLIVFDLLKNKDVQKYLEMYKLNQIKKSVSYD